MRRNLGEIFVELQNAKTKAEKVELLKKHDSFQLRCVLKLQFDEALRFLLPKGKPPIKEEGLPPGLGHVDLHSRLGKIYLFLDGGHPTLPQATREKLFMQLCEALDALDLELLLALKDKKLKGVTQNLVKEVYPGLLEDERLRAQIMRGNML